MRAGRRKSARSSCSTLVACSAATRSSSVPRSKRAPAGERSGARAAAFRKTSLRSSGRIDLAVDREVAAVLHELGQPEERTCAAAARLRSRPSPARARRGYGPRDRAPARAARARAVPPTPGPFRDPPARARLGGGARAPDPESTRASPALSGRHRAHGGARWCRSRPVPPVTSSYRIARLPSRWRRIRPSRCTCSRTEPLPLITTATFASGTSTPSFNTLEVTTAP